MTSTTRLKKGDRVLLAYGEQNGDLAGCDNFKRWLNMDFHNSTYKAWEAVLQERPNLDGTVIAEVEGFETEIGSIYNHDIIAVLRDGCWDPVNHTEAEIDLREQVKLLTEKL